MAHKEIDGKEFARIVDEATIGFKGDITDLEKAIGVFSIARHFGWKPLMLIHDKRTIKKYEKILSIELRDIVPEVGEQAKTLNAWKVILKIGGFWNAVKGLKKGIRSPIVE